MINQSEEYTEKAFKVVDAIEELHYIKECDIQFVVLTSDEEKKKAGKIVYADCRKVNKYYEWCCPYDFLITMYMPNCELLSDEQTNILLWHELKHIGVDMSNGEPVYMVNPHDIEDFKSIIDRFGYDWNEEGKVLPDVLGGDVDG